MQCVMRCMIVHEWNVRAFFEFFFLFFFLHFNECKMQMSYANAMIGLTNVICKHCALTAIDRLLITDLDVDFLWMQTKYDASLDFFIFSSGLTLYRQSNSFSIFYPFGRISGCQFYSFTWTYLWLPLLFNFFLPGLASECQFFQIFIYLDLPLIASFIHLDLSSGANFIHLPGLTFSCQFFPSLFHLPGLTSECQFYWYSWKSLILTKLSSFVRRSFWSFYRVQNPLSFCIPVSDE